MFPKSRHSGFSMATPTLAFALTIAVTFSFAFAFVLSTLVSAPALAADKDTIVFGTAMSLTGNYAREGKFYEDSYQLAIDTINAQGGVTVGGKKYRLALKLYDDQSNADQVVKLFTRLITVDKVDFLLGPYGSPLTLPASSVSEKYGIPMVEGGGASANIFNRGYKYIFGTLPRAEDYFSSTIEMATKVNPKPKTAALLFANDAFDRSVATGSREWLKKFGVDLVYDQMYAPDTQDFSSVITAVKAKGVDMVLVAGHTENSLNFIKQAKSLGYAPKMYAFTVGPPTADFRETLATDANYAFGITGWLPGLPYEGAVFKSAAEFNKVFKAKYGYDPDYHVASGAADVLIYKYAIEKADSLDPDKVRDTIASIDFETFYGRIHFDQGGQIIQDQFTIQIQNGKVVPIFSEGKFFNKPQYPMPAWSSR